MRKLLTCCAFITNVALSIDYEIDIDIMAYGQVISQKNGVSNTYMGELCDIIGNIRLNDDIGAYTELVSDKRCIHDRLPEINAAYIYYVFDVAGELRLGCDVPLDSTMTLLPKKAYEQRSAGSYFNTVQSECFNRYSIVDSSSMLKISWISPTYGGVRLAISYAPDSSICRGKCRYSPVKHLACIGLSYEKGLSENVNVGLSVIGVTGQSGSYNARNAKSCTFEGYLSYKNLTINGRIVSDFSSLKADNKNDTSYAMNAIYKHKRGSIYVGRFISHRNSIKSKYYSIGFTQKIMSCEGFAEYKRMLSEDNNGHIVIFGVKKHIHISR